MIGGNPQGGPNNRNWNGLIDDVAIWCRVLTDGEIAQIYNGGAGASIGALLGLPVIADDWRDANYPPAGSSTRTTGPGADLALGANGLTNLESFAQGLDPNGASPGAIMVDLNSGSIVSPGTFDVIVEPGPAYSVIYGRRVDYQDAGLKYTLEFSADMTTWEAGGDAGTVVATGAGADGPLEAVKVAYPWILSNGRKARFVRLITEIVYPD